MGPSAQSAFFVGEDGAVYGTGLNDRGQLGVGDTENRKVLTLVDFSEDVFVKHVSAAGDHTLSR